MGFCLLSSMTAIFGTEKQFAILFGLLWDMQVSKHAQ